MEKNKENEKTSQYLNLLDVIRLSNTLKISNSFISINGYYQPYMEKKTI